MLFRKFIKKSIYFVLCYLSILPIYTFADTAKPNVNKNKKDTTSNVVQQRAQEEKKAINNPYFISFYKPNYLLPFYYTGRPYYQIYENNTPDNQSINHTEVNFQLSFKVPVIRNLYRQNTNLYLAYTQVSFWQAYNDSPFFRETNYEPEIFLSNEIDKEIIHGWNLSYLNFGVMHQSNGRGGDDERSWNRVYTELTFANGNWMVDVKPWYIIRDHSLNTYNPNIGSYLGYERALIVYKFNRQEFAFQARNTFESNFRRGAYQFTWSFPIYKHLNGYALLFGGYGQSLVEYNHYTNSAGIGISLSNWV